MEALKEKLAELDHAADSSIQAAKYREAFDAMEEALNIRRELYGETSDEFYKTAEKLCELCNMLSMILLQKEKFDAALEFLKKAEVLGQNSHDLRAITYNNLACYYRRIGKLRIALKYLQDALSIESKLEKSKTLADTHLNICAVYSQLGKHDQAKEHIMQSIILLQDEFLGNKLSTDKNTNSEDKNKSLEDRVAVLAIAYHNLGVEYEYLKQFDEAISTYKKAVQFAKSHLGENNQVVQNLENVLMTAQGQIDAVKSKAKPKTSGKAYNTTTTRNGTTDKFKRAQTVYNNNTNNQRTKIETISYGGQNRYDNQKYIEPQVMGNSNKTPLMNPVNTSNNGPKSAIIAEQEYSGHGTSHNSELMK